MANSCGVSLRVPQDLWDRLALIASSEGLSLGAVSLAGQFLTERVLARALQRASTARKKSAYLAQSRYIWVDRTLFKQAQEAAADAKVSFSTFAIALLFVTQGQRTKAFERLLKAKETKNARVRAKKLRAKAQGLLKEAERLEALA